MIKRKIVAAVFVGITCLTAVAGGAKKDVTKVAPITIRHEYNDSAPETMKFLQNGKIIFSYTAPDQFYPRLGLYYPVDPPFQNRWRFSANFFEKNKTVQDYLIDLKGNGDRRYFLIQEWSGGNGGFFMTVIDVKDNFKKMIRFEAAELVDFKHPNPKLEFPVSIGAKI